MDIPFTPVTVLLNAASSAARGTEGDKGEFGVNQALPGGEGIVSGCKKVRRVVPQVRTDKGLGQLMGQ